VIFDGVLNLSEFASSYQQAGITIRFSPEGVTADDVIKEMVHEEKTRAMVVTSDHSIINYTQTQGGDAIPSPEFYDKLVQANLMGEFDKGDDAEKEAPKHKRWMTYKKGPSKKPPKKDRRQRQRAKKL